MLAILATQEAEIRRIMVRSQPGEIVHKTLSLKHPLQERWSGLRWRPRVQTSVPRKKETLFLLPTLGKVLIPQNSILNFLLLFDFFLCDLLF
jgi:hypothetical protein